jgi:8-oxo-dGTP diphosphatase
MSLGVERDPLVETVDVVVGVLLHQQKFLVERRRLDEPIDPGIVCLPGGHVQRGESHADALIREMKEELDITVKDFTLICMNSHVASNGERQHAYCYLITSYDGTPVSNVAQEVFWEDDADGLNLEVDRHTIQRAQEHDAYKNPGRTRTRARAPRPNWEAEGGKGTD